MADNEVKRSRSCLVMFIVWMVIIGILAVAAKFLVLPHFRDQLADETGSDARYKYTVRIAMDAFSGYAPLRGEVVRDLLRNDGIRLAVEDDQADYAKRIRMLKNGNVDMAVFTVDSFILAGAQLGEWPGTIVMIIDESDGADAIVSYEAGIKTIADLNRADGKFVMTPNSPSEFLARTVISHFDLEQMSSGWRVEADGAGDVLAQFTDADRAAPRAYVLWEPYVSRALAQPGSRLLLDSSKLRGYIIDVLVAERSFLKKHPEQVRAVIQAYLSASYKYNQSRADLTKLIREDAESFGGEEISAAQADKLCAAIAWKGTLENYAYFGLLNQQQMQGGKHIEDVIVDVTDVLVRTGALKSDPLQGRSHQLFYDALLRELRDSSYHPGKALNPLAANQPLAVQQAAVQIRALDDAGWKRLRPVGTIRIPPISFGRGTARIHTGSQRSLQRIAKTLSAWPGYYLQVVGHASQRGDPEANRRLAQERAETVRDELIRQGVPAAQLRAVAPPEEAGKGRAVSFRLLQAP